MIFIKKFLFLLSPNERKKISLLIFMLLIMALLDVIGVASILPFIAILTNPSIIETNLIVKFIYQSSFMIGVENEQQFLFVLGIIVFLLLLFSLSFKSLTIYFQERFVQNREYSIGKRLLERYFNQPYSWFLNRNSSDLSKTILSEIGNLIGSGFRPLMDLIAKGIVAISLIILLIVVDIKLAFIIGFLLGSAYGLIFFFLRKILNQIGLGRFNSNQKRFNSVNEAFGAVKELKLGGLEKIYINRFSESSQNYAKSIASSQVISQLPRFLLEAIAFGGILLILLYIISQTGSFQKALPIISLYVFAGYRLMPALQQIYASATQLSFVAPALNGIYEELKNLDNYDLDKRKDKLSFNKSISLKNISYSYPNSFKLTLNDINLDIPYKSKIGLVGPTGSGKTTLVDIILGLLEPQNGSLEIDNQNIINKNERIWQNSLGYVPQHIFLSDDTIAANIAFGEESDKIIQKDVETAAKIANLHDFVLKDLPNKYETLVGERGIRLSGGQRQRIGIARALYHKPEVLILDEATSALDNQTEKAVMDAVNNLGRDITIILIAHRLNTVKDCDTIFKLDNGNIVARGNYDQIIST